MQQLLETILNQAVADGFFPAAAGAVGVGDQVLGMHAAGRLWLPDGPQCTLDTRFDMASLTKVMATTPVALLAIQQGRLTLDDTIGRYLDAPRDRAGITVRQLMTHTSGINPHILLNEACKNPEDAVSVILNLPLEGAAGIPRYSCLGFIVLGKMLEALYQQPLDRLAQDMVFGTLGMADTGFCPTGGNFAATEVDPATGQPLIGVVHDENARFLGGVSANAGLFSTVGDTARFASMLASGGGGLLFPATLKAAIYNRTPGQDSHRGLGFHLGGTEGCYLGELLPACAFGHTGFTGTSIAVDPTTGFFTVLLTNRVHPSRENERHLRFRRTTHNRLYAAFSQTSQHN